MMASVVRRIQRTMSPPAYTRSRGKTASERREEKWERKQQHLADMKRLAEEHK